MSGDVFSIEPKFSQVPLQYRVVGIFSLPGGFLCEIFSVTRNRSAESFLLPAVPCSGIFSLPLELVDFHSLESLFLIHRGLSKPAGRSLKFVR